MTTNSPNPVDGDVQALIERAESAEARLVELENQKLNAEVKLYRQESIIPEGLNRCTAELVMDFSKALAEKLHRSEKKYGWSDGWKDIDWQEKCLADFNHHISKGDPRDVAAYCAFMWFHGWQTRHTAQPNQLLRPVELPDIEDNELAFNAGLNSLVDCLQDCGDAEQGLRLALRSISEKWHEVKS